MNRRILDTARLINHWIACRPRRLADCSIADARRWAGRLIELKQTKSLLTPIVIEFLAGTQSSHELKSARAFLAEFVIEDQGRISDQDWKRARQLAERVPRDGGRRQLGDCLIRAIAERLHFDIDTPDTEMPRTGRRR